MKIKGFRIYLFIIFSCGISLFISSLFLILTPSRKQQQLQLLGNYFSSETKAQTTLFSLEKEIKNYLDQNRIERWKLIEKELKNQKKSKNLPQMIGIGMEDCGIDDLFNLLLPHPSVRIHFNPESKSFGHLNNAHIEKYLKSLPEIEEKAYLIEKKSLGFHLPPYNIPYFVKTFFSKTKLLLIVCEPAHRALDDFNHEKLITEAREGKSKINEFKTFDDFLHVYLPFVKRNIGDFNSSWKKAEEENKLFDLLHLQRQHGLTSILTKSFYALHLKRWFNHYDHTDLMVIDSGELYENPGALVEKIQNFVSLPKLLVKDDFFYNYTRGSWCFKNNNLTNVNTCLSSVRDVSTLTEQSNLTLAKLKNFYKSHNRNLFKILGRDFNW